TARSLGIINDEGLAIMPVRVVNATAERLTDGTVRIRATTEANTGGWQVFADTLVDGDLLRVNVKGTPPEGIATEAITRYPVDLTVRDTGDIKKVVVQGDGAPINLELGSPGLELVRQIHQQASALYDSYKEAVGAGRRGTND